MPKITKPAPPPTSATVEELLSALRKHDWTVTTHYDYFLKGVFMTFWLFTHHSGRWVKGESGNDRTALHTCVVLAAKSLRDSGAEKDADDLLTYLYKGSA